MNRRFIHRLRGLIAYVLFFSALAQSSAFTPVNSRKPAEQQAFSPSQVALDTCQIICPGNLTFTLDPGECAKVVTYEVAISGDCASSAILQTEGLPSGSSFPIGTTHNCFSIDLDPVGSPDGDVTCCFDVVVNGYPNPIPQIACTDLAFISLDDQCQHCITAGEVLEGGPYSCFNVYTVEIDKTPPYGNGPWVPACVGAADINKTYQVRITEPQFGNKCWGNVKIEDKLAPKLECHDLVLPCGIDPNQNPEPAPATTSVKQLFLTGLQDSIGAASAPVPDLKEYTLDFSSLPAGATVLDANCRIKISGHDWLPDLQITLTAPDGTSANLFSPSGCTGAAWPVDVLLDDEGVAIATCAELNAGGNSVQCQDLNGSNSSILAAFDSKNASGVWKLSISDVAAGSAGLIEIAGLELAVSLPKFTPSDNCAGQFTLTHSDVETLGDCSSGYVKLIERSWVAWDISGNSSHCIQNITVTPQSLSDLQWPGDYNGADAPSFSCTAGAYPTPQWIESQQLQGSPLAGGYPVGCNMNSDYVDTRIDVCDGTYKILRHWTVINWCTAEILEKDQIIKVIDDQGPTFSCPANLTVSTDAFDCCATVNLPDVVITDDCSRMNSANATIKIFDVNSGQQTGVQNLSGSLTDFPGNNHSNPDTLAAFGSTQCLPLGNHIVEYFAEDNCGNTATCSFQLAVKDYTPPGAVCDEKTVVAIGIDDFSDCFGPAGPFNIPPAFDACTFGGVSWVQAKYFDDGSYDNCGHIKFTIRRAAPYSDCILGLNSINGKLPCDDAFPDFPSEFERAISESDSIKFYSCEVGSTQSVILRVYQLNASGGFDIGPDGFPIFNECTVQVEVTDKIKPVCIAPAEVSVTCENFDPSLFAYGIPTLADNCCLDPTQTNLGQCGLTHSADYTNFDTICNKGTVLRRFQATDCSGNTSTCTQRIVVNYNQDYYVHFPSDVIVTNCSSTGNYGEPTFFGEDCELLGTSYEDQIFTVVPDACYKIERTWSVINWCTYNPGLPSTVIPNPQPNPIINHPTNLPGPIVSSCNAPAPWSPTIVKVNPTDSAATNYCNFWSPAVNRYEYKQIIKIIDSDPPVVLNCQGGQPVFTDGSINDPALWNNVFNPNLPAQNLAEGDADLSITATDECSGSQLTRMDYLLFLDLDHDGLLESVVNSANLSGADTIRYNNINTPNYSGGTPVTFDSRSVPQNMKYHFTLEREVAGLQATASLRWNTEAAPNTYSTPQLPQGTHKIRWIVGDFCGNESVCEYTFTVKPDSTSGTISLENDGFALMQNEPNPFNGSTTIGFRLPESADATLKVFDGEGRLVYTQSGQFKQGYNAVQVEAGALNAPGVLYYRLESGQHVAWKKMVLIH